MSFSTLLLADCFLPAKVNKLYRVPYPILFQVLLCMVKTFVYCKQMIFTDLILTGSILYFYTYWETADYYCQYTDNLNTVKYETNRYFRNKREHMKDKMNEPTANKKIKNIGNFSKCII